MGDEVVEGWGMYLCTCSGNATGDTFLLPALLPSMLDQGRGHIVVISSLQGKIGLPYRSSCE